MPRGERNAAPKADGERTVYTLVNGAPSAVTVHAGVTDGKDTQIVSGDIKAGDEVIISSKAGSK